MDAVVIQLNHISYAYCGGKVMDVPCGDDVDILGDYYGTPHTSGGVFQGYDISKASSAPRPDSIQLVRLYDKGNGNTIHVLGTVAQFRAACDDPAGAPMPLATTVPVVVPEINLCAPITPGGTDFTLWWDLPAKTGSQEYRAWVSYNGTQTTPALSTGHASLAAMVTWLNTNYSAVGTWSADGSRLKLVRASAAKVGVTFTVGDYS